MQKLIAIITTGAFIYLASYSYGRYEHHHSAQHCCMAWKSKKAAIIADIYGLTPYEVAKPVEIFK
jgi:hypothetical protein